MDQQQNDNFSKDAFKCHLLHTHTSVTVRSQQSQYDVTHHAYKKI